MKYNIIFVFLLLSMPLVLATENVNIDDTLTIRISNTTTYNLATDEITLKIEFISNKDSFNNKDFIFTVKLGNGTVFATSIKKEFPSFPYRVIIEDTAENVNFASELIKCVEEKGKIDNGYKLCILDLNKYKGKNATLCGEDLNACNLKIQQKDIEIQGKGTTIENLEEEKKGTKNLIFFYVIIAFIAGIIGCLFYMGKIGKDSAKEKSMGEFNKGQAG